MTRARILGTQDALCQELDEIKRRRQRSGTAARFEADDLETHDQAARRLKLSALCLSGGGVRSAAFCLGVLQNLSTRRLLGEFDYLSTVSGGGFIGGWLQMLIRECGSVAQAEELLTQPRPPALRRLRAYTNYLTPQTGPFSIDTWAAAVVYLRNTMINWAIFGPLFMLLALLPITYRTLIWACSGIEEINWLLLAGAAASLLYGVVTLCSLLPSHRPPRSDEDPTPAFASPAAIRRGIVYPALGWTLLIPWVLDFATAHASHAPEVPLWLADHASVTVAVLYLVLMTVAFGLAWARQAWRTDPGLRLFRLNYGRWIAASIGSAMLTWVLLRIIVNTLPNLASTTSFALDPATTLAVFAPLALTMVHVLQTSLYVALRRENGLADLDREWLGRANAMLLRLAVGWTVLAFGCLVLTLIAVNQRDVVNTWQGGFMAQLAGVMVIVGAAGAWLGKIWPSVETLGKQSGAWDYLRAHVRTWLPPALGLLFAAFVLVVAGGTMNLVLAEAQRQLGGWVVGSDEIQKQPPWLPLLFQAVVAVILLVGVLTFRKVNVNRFSMHAVYRNRLVRAFLGSPRAERKQEPFTGFDPADNQPIASLLRNADSLFPVVNMTLNISAGNNTAWAERQAASFTATPLTCGSAALRHPQQDREDPESAGAFVATERFAGCETLRSYALKPPEMGLGLGSLLTVSGAAVSPVWGYHSSRLTAFLMTLFNVRLGVWLPNPSTATTDELRLARPRNSLTALLDEMLGATTDDSQAVYLSDGGHFENLGVYEMLRRRCHSILVVDAGADDACSMFDLGNAIRKAEIDFGIKVAMQEPMRVYSRKRLEAGPAPDPAPLGFACGTIDYNDGEPGRLLYIKPSFLARIPADVRAYGAEHELFPHESTLDQWFSESQFESYRLLGWFQLQELTAAARDRDLPSLFDAAWHATQLPVPANDEDGADQAAAE